MSGLRRGGPARRIATLVLWIAVTAGIAFLVARNADSSTGRSPQLSVPPVEIGQRATATIDTHTIQPILSADGTVVADGTQWAIEALVVPQAQAYQLLTAPVGIKALIDGGPAGFDCAWLGLGQGGSAVSTEGRRPGAGTGGSGGNVTMRCRIPAGIKVVAGLPATMVLQLTAPQEKPGLPVTAVVGSSGQGQVVVVNADGTTSVRTVGIGIADTFWVEITSGLDPGETVLAAPVQTDFANPRS